MFRMIMLTLGSLYGLLAFYGTPEMNRALTEVQDVVTAGDVAGDVVPAPPVMAVTAPAATLTPATVVQTAPAGPRFPGPALVPSPEHAGASLAPAAAGALVVSADSVNLRAGPATGHPRVGTLLRGTAVTPIGPTTGAWVEVRDTSGLQGFVSARFLSPARPG